MQEQSDSKVRSHLATAAEQFHNRDYAACRKSLADTKTTHLSIELNNILCEYKQSPAKIATALKRLMDILTAINITLYQDRPQDHHPAKNKKKSQKTPRISHQFYYWNIIVLSQLLPNPQITELVSSEALHFTDSMRTETSLMIIYEMLKTMESSGRLASCISLIEKQNRLISRVKKLRKEDKCYRFLNQQLFNRVLLKLGMMEGSRIMFNMRFSLSNEETKEEQEMNQFNNIPITIYQQLLQAEIEYHAKNYMQSIKILGDLIPQSDALGKNKDFIRSIIDHNTAIVLASYKQAAPAQLFFKKSLAYFTTAKELELNNEKANFIMRSKQNLLLASISIPNPCYTAIYDSLKAMGSSYSFKINYRKGQICLNYYHELLQSTAKTVTHKQIHDFYETVYYYPNMPYFQQKGKNKNVNFTNGKYFYRRYVLSQWEQTFNNPENVPSNVSENLEKGESKGKQQKEKEVKREPSKQKKKVIVKTKAKKEQQHPPIKEEAPKIEARPKQTDHRSRIREILDTAEIYFRQALTIIQKERSIIVNLQGEEKGFTQQVNEKLHSQYIEYRSNIYSQLCYINLCRHEWSKTLHYAIEYENFEKNYQLQNKNATQQKIHYNILTYKMEALCELNRIANSYEVMHDLISTIDYSEQTFLTRSTANQKPGQTYFEKISQYNNFCYNISVLHSKDNKIPEAYQSIQKILQQMRLSPSNPQTNLPLSLIDLLIHYNLRTSNNSSALQIIKRRRILNVPGVLSHYQPILNVCK